MSQEKNTEKERTQRRNAYTWRNNDWRVSKFTENYIPTDSAHGVQWPTDLIQGDQWPFSE